MVAGHPGGHGGGAAKPVVVGHSTEGAIVQFVPQGGIDAIAVDIITWDNLATPIIVLVRVCNQC